MLDKNFCTIKSYNSLEELLTKELSFSKSLVRKYLNKKILTRPLPAKYELYIPLDILNSGFINPLYTGPAMEVIGEDENFIAINKPHGVHGHALSYSETNTVLNFLRSTHRWSLFLDKNNDAESFLLYRLDRETSGVLIFAKSAASYSRVRESFSNSAKTKSYLAIVRGEFNLEGRHQHFLEGSGPRGAVMKVVPQGNRSVEINVSGLKFNSELNLSLIKVELKEGIRHQIRCQLGAIGFPILGDTLYGGEDSNRVYLHAHQYEISSADFKFSATANNDELFLSLFDLNSCL